MPWGPIYTHTYCDRFDRPCQVIILEEDYLGAATEVDAGPSPVVISYESSSDDKFDALRASTASITLIGDDEFDLEFLWTADEKKYQVESWIDGALDWRGFIIPNGFRYQFTGGKYYAAITASDGLSTLQAIPFLAENGEPYNLVDLVYNDGARYPFILIAIEILRKLDLDLNLWSCIDVYEQRMIKTGGREGDPLSNSTVDVRTYINDSDRDDIPYWQDIDQVFDCERVLRNLCSIWGAKIYQQGGAWKLKRINADATDGEGATLRYWRKYNTAAVYIGLEQVTDNVLGSCVTDELELINDSHTMAMDRVFGQVAVNYKFTFLREGDSPVNLIKNGNFIWPSLFLAPPNWRRAGNIHIEKGPGTAPDAPSNVDIYGSITPHRPTINAWLESSHIDISQGDNLIMNWGHRTPGLPGNRAPFGIYAIIIEQDVVDSEGRYWLVNDQVQGNVLTAKWVQSTSPIYFRGYPGAPADDFWRKVEIEAPAAPISGELFIRVHGLGSPFQELIDWQPGDPGDQFAVSVFPCYGIIPGTVPVQIGPVNYFSVDDQYGQLTVAGFFVGLIKNVSSDETPNLHRYLYPVPPRSGYTDRPDPVEVLNGDTVDVDHVSYIDVPAAGSGVRLFWDTIDEKYGYSSIGLILAKSIADQYYLPNRILEGDFMGEEMTFSSRIELDYLPGVRFIVQRGSYDVKNCWWIGTTLIQVSDQPIPPGGTDGGNTVDPIWEDTGNTRCVKEDGLNTGAVEKQQQDINPASQTYGQTRWVPAGTDTVMCPIGEPSDYYWGAEPAVYNVDNFITNPFTLVTNGVLVNFTNAGGKYLFFLHRIELGLVVSILDSISSETISDWQYLSDTIIGGFTYKVMRMNYTTGIYTGIPMTFIFTT